MARITVEDCLRRVPNRFILVLMAAARTKQLLKGSKPRVQADNKEVVLALREIAAGKVALLMNKNEKNIGKRDNG
jgi:DNA-directed RNA polymerase subunit omega